MSIMLNLVLEDDSPLRASIRHAGALRLRPQLIYNVQRFTRPFTAMTDLSATP